MGERKEREFLNGRRENKEKGIGTEGETIPPQPRQPMRVWGKKKRKENRPK